MSDISDADSDADSDDFFTMRARYLEDAFDRASRNDPTLTEIDIFVKHVGDVEAARLVAALAGNTFVNLLKLNCRYVNDEVMASLAEALGRNTTLRTLILWWSNWSNDISELSAEAMSSLVLLLRENRSLHHLSVGGSVNWDNISLLVASVASGLRGNTTLQELQLYGVNVGPDDIAPLASALRENIALQTLGLDSIKMKPKVVASLVSALRENVVLQALYVDDSCVGDEDAVSLASLLQESKTLQMLLLKNNKISDFGVAFLADAIENNMTLTELDIEGNDNIGSSLLKQRIEKALARNKQLKKVNETTDRLHNEYNLSEAEGLTSALVDLNGEDDIFESVVFGILKKMPEVMERSFFGGSE